MKCKSKAKSGPRKQDREATQSSVKPKNPMKSIEMQLPLCTASVNSKKYLKKNDGTNCAAVQHSVQTKANFA